MVRLWQAGDEVVVIGGPGEAAIARDTAGSEALDLGGRLALPELAAALAAFSMVVTNDTGPMHLAAAVGTPIVAFFGPDTPERSRPLARTCRILWHSELPCSPCLHGECPRTGAGTVLPSAVHECMELITVEDTLAAIASLREELQGAG
jgi:heptosyltransferase-2